MDRSHTPIARVEPDGVRLFTEKGTAVASAIGGPLASTYLIAKNFRSLGKQHAARLTLILGGAFTVTLFTILALLPWPVAEKIPREVIPLGYGIVGYVVVKGLQQRDIDAHLQAGGKKGSWQMIVGSGLISLALSLGFYFNLVLLNPSQSQPFAGRPYKFEKTGSILYYDPINIPEADAKFVGNELEEMGYFSKDTRLPAAFRKEGSKYTIELLVDNNHWDSVNDDVSQFLRVLRQWHQDSEFQVRFLGTESTGGRKTKILSQ